MAAPFDFSEPLPLDDRDDEKQRPKKRRQRDYQRLPQHWFIIQIVAASLLALALLMFFLPWLGIYESGRRTAKPIVTQSGIQIATGDGSLHPALEEEKEKERKAGKTPASNKDINKSAPWLLLFPLLVGIAAGGCAFSRDPNRISLVVIVTLGCVLLLMIIQFGIVGPPLESAIAKSVSRDHGAEAAIEFERLIETRYSVSFYCSIAFVVVALAANIYLLIAAKIRYPRSSWRV